MGFLDKLFGKKEDPQVKKIRPIADTINSFEEEMKALSDEKLRAKTVELKEKLNSGSSLEDILPEAFAVVREGALRSINLRHYDVQLIGGVVLHQGRIAEMRTGEGKTLVSTLAAYLNALSGKGVHIVTVNDYLAKRDAEWMGKVHKFLGLSVGVILSQMNPEERREAYACDITYGTNSEFGFDYLRDNMCVYKESMVQRELNYAIVDEVDSILIDEARTPLIISGKGEASTDQYVRADKFVKSLNRGEDSTQASKLDAMSQTAEEAFKNSGDFTVDEKMKTVALTATGITKAEQFYGIERLTDADNTEINHHILQALKANALFKIDVNYVIQEGQIMIVDEFTGRIMYGRRYSEGLHQAIEAKEGVKVKHESKTLATITYQNFFRMYKKLSGMTGTAKTEEAEFQGIYKLDVVTIPTNRPNIRKDYDDLIYFSEKGKYNAVVDEVVNEHKSGRPVLVGTISVEKSEMLSSMLKMRGIKHEVLNAKYHEKEAEIIAQAGKENAVTIATNMAGRGTDILLGGNTDYLAKRAMRQEGYEEDLIDEATGHAETDSEEIISARKVYNDYFIKFKKETDKEHEEVVALGGLHIIGTERHESRRIDNQLRGRAARQGDPGSSKFFLSLDDDLLRLFGGEGIKNMASKLGGDMEDTPMEMGILTKQIENAQKRVESMHFNSRKHVLQYDDVMNKQREVIYAQRGRVLLGEDIQDAIIKMINDYVDTLIHTYCPEGQYGEDWDFVGMWHQMEELMLDKFENPFASMEKRELEDLQRDKIRSILLDIANKAYKMREDELAGFEISMRNVERDVLLRVVDMNWMDHIDAMDHLRDGVSLQAYAHRDPAQEYALQGFDMFEGMVRSINETAIKSLLHVSVRAVPTNRGEEQKDTQAISSQAPSAAEEVKAVNPQQPRRAHQANPTNSEPAKPFKAQKTVGRNDPCPCGSGKKYKSCCGKGE